MFLTQQIQVTFEISKKISQKLQINKQLTKQIKTENLFPKNQLYLPWVFT